MKTHERRILQAGGGALLAFASVLLAGCNPALDPNDYGEVVTELPQIEGADKPFPLPQLEDPQEPDKDAKK